MSDETLPADTPVFAPVHMKGADEIAQVFGVGRATVIRWAEGGAPIYLIGKKYQAKYDELWGWLAEKAKNKKPVNYAEPITSCSGTII